MPEKIKHTKNELRRQKEALKIFTRFLPTLLRKKQQLQMEILNILHAMEELETKIREVVESAGVWAAVFGEDVGMPNLISVERVHTTEDNIAGIDIPVFEGIDFKEAEYDFMILPLWVDDGIAAVKELMTLRLRYQILEKQLVLVREELRITTQRVNLFEKVKIPQITENIRRIRIVLGDMQTAAVVTGKTAKRKIERKGDITSLRGAVGAEAIS